MNIKNLKVGDKVILFSLAYVKRKWAEEIEEGIPNINSSMEDNWNLVHTIENTTNKGRDNKPRVRMKSYHSYKPEWIRRRV